MNRAFQDREVSRWSALEPVSDAPLAAKDRRRALRLGVACPWVIATSR